MLPLTANATYGEASVSRAESGAAEASTTCSFVASHSAPRRVSTSNDRLGSDSESTGEALRRACEALSPGHQTALPLPLPYRRSR